VAQQIGGDVDGAMKFYTSATRINAGPGLAYSNRANACLNKGNYQAAIANANKAIDSRGKARRCLQRARLGQKLPSVASTPQSRLATAPSKSTRRKRSPTTTGPTTGCGRAVSRERWPIATNQSHSI